MAALLEQVHEDLGHAVLMVTHDPRVAAYADRIVFLKDGKIVNETHLGRDGDGAGEPTATRRVDGGCCRVNGGLRMTRILVGGVSPLLLVLVMPTARADRRRR